MSQSRTAEPPSNAELLAALQDPGDARQLAWNTLVSRYSNRMYAVARSFGLDQATAEDLVQTAWLRLLERVGQVRDPDALGAWLCTIIRNEARRLITRRREVPSVLGLDEQAGTDDPPETRLVREERDHLLRRAFTHLGDDCRQLLRLLVVEPRVSYDEIAAAMGRPRGSLGPTRRRCLESLKSHLPTGFEP